MYVPCVPTIGAVVVTVSPWVLSSFVSTFPLILVTSSSASWVSGAASIFVSIVIAKSGDTTAGAVGASGGVTSTCRSCIASGNRGSCTS